MHGDVFLHEDYVDNRGDKYNKECKESTAEINRKHQLQATKTTEAANFFPIYNVCPSCDTP